MDHYLDINLKPDPEFPSHQLMDALFAKLHRVLAEMQVNDIGLSFPLAGSIREGLGARMRLHGTDARLREVADRSWWTGMDDFLSLQPVSPVPIGAKPLAVRRVQAKSNPERLRRRQMKRKGWTVEQARAAIPDSAGESLALPFLTVRSASSKQRFRLFISQTAATSLGPGTFNAYGLSTTATLPTF